MSEKFNPEDPNISENTEFFPFGQLQEYYRNNFEHLNPELGGRALHEVEIKTEE